MTANIPSWAGILTLVATALADPCFAEAQSRTPAALVPAAAGPVFSIPEHAPLSASGGVAVRMPPIAFQEVEREMAGWKVIAITTAAGALLGATAGYLLFGDPPDSWFTRETFAIYTGAQGALVGAGAGIGYVIVRRIW